MVDETQKTDQDQSPRITYFQYLKEQDIPIFIRVNLSLFEGQVLPFLIEHQFSELSQSEVEEIFINGETPQNGRVLTLCVASQNVSRHIQLLKPTDKYGFESIIPKKGYRVYRYFNVGMMVYSFSAREWDFGCYANFGESENIIAYRSVLNRYLSWSLASLGIIGFWGVPVDEGIVVLSQAQSQGEVVFVDVYNNRLISVDGIRNIQAGICVLRLSTAISGKNVEMKQEELLSFLYQYSSYLDYQGLPIIARQLIQTVSRNSYGLIHPKESFKPRTDLSL